VVRESPHAPVLQVLTIAAPSACLSASKRGSPYPGKVRGSSPPAARRSPRVFRRRATRACSMPALLHSVVSPRTCPPLSPTAAAHCSAEVTSSGLRSPRRHRVPRCRLSARRQQIARRDEEAVLAQPLDDRRPCPRAAPVTKATRLPDVTTLFGLSERPLAVRNCNVGDGNANNRET